MKKPKISQIKISDEERARLEAMLTCNFTRSRLHDVREIVGGLCVVCAKLPSKRVTIDVSDFEGKGARLEYYCNSHFEVWVEEQRSKRRLEGKEKKT